ncbi:MAG: phospholipid carrier-dependent glycosyltransferase [Candidatus Eremiobacteraeota bacterium]|nr:phospholipid carrier-dependent glycosyltransferase [Candidatus Eremiobacteraeota bacterium]MCW5872469.1 phospholipid carrier-dependent glycosyltransferase [Candidatus Eremiobacteraeota bacterium]
MSETEPPEPSEAPWTRQHWLLLGAILLIGLFMRVCLLGFPPNKFFDEIYYVDAANDYLKGIADANSVHPPLAKMQLAATILLFDVAKLHGLTSLENTVGWRLAPALAGVGTVGLTAWLAFVLLRRPRTALLAAALVAVEHLSVAESRICTLDSIQAFWIMLGICCGAERIWRSEDDKWLWFSAMALGVATGCKWNGLFAAAGVVLGLWTIRVGALPKSHPLKVFFLYALVIPAIYAAAYIPFARTLPPARQTVGQVFSEVKAQHIRMWKFRKDPKQFKHQYLSPMWQWPFVIRPIWFHFRSEPSHTCSGIVAFGMVPFYWLSVYLLLECLAGAWTREYWDPAGQFLFLTYGTQYFLWVSSWTGFFYYMLPMVPLMAVAVARQLDHWLGYQPTRKYAIGFLVVLAVMTLLYFPFMCGLTVPYKYFQALFFAPSWV